MNIQIGLPCEPGWLCECVGYGLAALAIVALLAFIKMLIGLWRK